MNSSPDVHGDDAEPHVTRLAGDIDWSRLETQLQELALREGPKTEDWNAMSGENFEYKVRITRTLRRLIDVAHEAAQALMQEQSVQAASDLQLKFQQRIGSLLFEPSLFALLQETELAKHNVSGKRGTAEQSLQLARRATDLCECRMSGQKLLQEAIFQHFRSQEMAAQLKGEVSTRTIPELVNLQHFVAKECGEDAGAIVTMLFHILDGDIATLRALIHTQRQTEGSLGKFLKYASRFIGTYCDVTEAITQKMGGAGPEETDDQRKKKRVRQSRANTMQILKKMFGDHRLWAMENPGSQFDANLHTMLKELLDQTPTEQHPWFWGNLDATPFTASNLGSLLSTEVPREALAGVLVSLHAYSDVMLAARAKAYVTTHENIPENITARRMAQIRKEIEALMHAAGIRPFPDDSVEDHMHVLYAWAMQSAEDPLKPITISKESPANLEAVCPEFLFLRLIDPRKIMQESGARNEFFKLYLSVMNSPTLPKNEPILIRSLQIVLARRDPWMELPFTTKGVSRCFHNKTIRGLYTELAIRSCDHKTLLHGPLMYHGDPDSHNQHPVIPSSDHQWNMKAGNHFDSAGGTKFEREVRLQDAEKILMDIAVQQREHPESETDYEFALRSATEACREAHNARDFDFYFYPFANFGFAALMQDYNLNPGNYIIGNQEYPVMLKQAHGKHREIDVFADGGTRMKTPKELCDALLSQMDENTQFALISRALRFGDVACATEGLSLDNALSQFIKQVRTECKKRRPKMRTPAIVIDDAQGLGRGMPANLLLLNADAYLTSASKGLALGEEAYVALRKGTHHHPAHPLFKAFTKTHLPSSQSAKRLLALGMSLRELLTTHDPFQLEGNTGVFAAMPLGEKINRHLAVLTDYVIRKAEEYGTNFVKRLNITCDTHPSLKHMSHEELTEMFGCKVAHPVHRIEEHYTGIVTVYFPNVNSERIVKGVNDSKGKHLPGINEMGFQALPCLTHERALRISCNYLQQPSDIDALFEAIMCAHEAKLKQDMNKEKLRNCPLNAPVNDREEKRKKRK